MQLKDFDFHLPEELIAQVPLEPRDRSRMMVIDRAKGELFHYQFTQLDTLLNPGDVLVLNKTKVIPARLFGKKEETGAQIEVLLLNRLETDLWEVILRPGKRLKVGQKVVFGEGLLIGELISINDNGNRVLRFQYEGLFEEILDELGKMPLPPYIHIELEDKERYQTVYAKENGSAAAPTAGLHFTEELLEKIRSKGIEILEITLHVGLGTFRPVKTEDIREHEMHSEYYRIDSHTAEKINLAKKEGRKVIAVGTTVVRTLESAAKFALTKEGELSPSDGWTDIFIYPGYEFKIIDGLVTNFHFPRSTLIMLVSAFANRDIIMKAYDTAVKERYRFFSFGDCMLIL